MNATVLIRVAKLVALLGFVLPWALVSCSGMPLATVSGLDLVMGQISVASMATGEVQKQDIGINPFLVVAALVIVVGFVLTFVGESLRRVGIAALVAAVATFGGMWWFKDMPRREYEAQRSTQSSQSRYPQLDAAAVAAIRIDEQTGYWVTLIALAGAAGVGIFGLSIGTAGSGRREET